MKVRKLFGETLTLATGAAFATVKGVPPGMNALMVEIPSATIENIFLGLCPKILQVKFYDQTAGDYTDLTAALTDRNTSTTSGTCLNSMTSSDILYVCYALPTRGMAVDVGTPNDQNQAMTGTYWNGSAWASLGTFTDGTNAGAGTLAQDGLITWALPTNWQTSIPVDGFVSGFWAKFVVAGTLKATTTVLELTALIANATNDYGLIRSNNGTAPPYFFRFIKDTGGIEMKSTSLTSACNLTWMSTD